MKIQRLLNFSLFRFIVLAIASCDLVVLPDYLEKTKAFFAKHIFAIGHKLYSEARNQFWTNLITKGMAKNQKRTANAVLF
jgi:hypothetical protein